MANIDAKKAAQAAASYLNDMRDLVDARLKDVRLEEIELLEDQEVWVVTLGYDVPSRVASTFDLLTPSLSPGDIVYKRDYKTFQVNSMTGEVQSMKIRSVS